MKSNESFDCCIDKASNGISFEFKAATWGFHVYQKNWQPELNTTLVCPHERGDEFEIFSTKFPYPQSIY